MKLAADTITAELSSLPGWVREENAISKVFRFQDFSGSVAFLDRIVPIANGMDHHPDADIRYNRVRIVLTTHDEGGITEKDIRLARELDKCAG
jgi:4a-hydroxytetrahydrobiopterin dehydratase